ncbi:hypothetical protein F5878DRAFT_647188 [Lentinula raphanica]|uniref:Uncharacterized protein n=1 Tax=Lentinula raphanica TaxID=153919 RepID=A0AA38NWL4_9AGAR|nr:hypothetical protein F5878DRAFT_647188 [Lentinula raphanica]
MWSVMKNTHRHGYRPTKEAGGSWERRWKKLFTPLTADDEGTLAPILHRKQKLNRSECALIIRRQRCEQLFPSSFPTSTCLLRWAVAMPESELQQTMSRKNSAFRHRTSFKDPEISIKQEFQLSNDPCFEFGAIGYLVTPCLRRSHRHKNIRRASDERPMSVWLKGSYKDTARAIRCITHPGKSSTRINETDLTARMLCNPVLRAQLLVKRRKEIGISGIR